MNIFIHELKASMRSALIWLLSLMGLAVFLLLVYPSFAVGADEVRRLFSGFPPELLKALNVDIESFLSVVGYYGFIFTYILLCGCVQAMMLGAILAAREFNRKTADFLFTKPVRRISMILQKIAAGIVILLITDILVIVASYITARSVSEGPFNEKPFWLISISLFLIEMMFFSLGLVFTAALQRFKNILGVSLGTVFGFFVIGMLGSTLQDEKVRYIVPLQYYDPIKIVREPSYEMPFVIINAVFVLIALIAAITLYVKKDIHAV